MVAAQGAPLTFKSIGFSTSPELRAKSFSPKFTVIEFLYSPDPATAKEPGPAAVVEPGKGGAPTSTAVRPVTSWAGAVMLPSQAARRVGTTTFGGLSHNQ